MHQPACKPGSVGCETPGAPHVTAIPLRRQSPGVCCNLPERQDPDMIPGRSPCRSYSVLLPVGFAVPSALP